MNWHEKPEFHNRQAEQEAWKAAVLSGELKLEEITVDDMNRYAHQNEDIVRLTAAELKAKMEAKEAAEKAAAAVTE